KDNGRLAMIARRPQYAEGVGLGELTTRNLFQFCRSGAMHSSLIGQELPLAAYRPTLPMFPNNWAVPNRNRSVAEMLLLLRRFCWASLFVKVTFGCVSFDSSLTLIKSGGDTSK